MLDQNYKIKLTRRLGKSKRFVTNLFGLLILTFASGLIALAQTSNGSTATDASGEVVIRDGRRYVLVAERTFGQIEKLVKEVPALREENDALKEKSANDDKVIASQDRIIKLKEQEVAAERSAREASERETLAVRKANEANEKALEISQKRVAELEQKVKKANRRALYGILAAAAAILLGGR